MNAFNGRDAIRGQSMVRAADAMLRVLGGTEVSLRFATPGLRRLMVKAVNAAGVAQPDHPNWNGGGFMRNVIESLSVQVS